MITARSKANVSTVDSFEIGIVAMPYVITKQFFTKVWINEAVWVKVMLDSGSAGNFISPGMVTWCGLTTHKRERPLSVTHVQGGKVGMVTEQVLCTMRKGKHSKLITFDVVPLGKHVIIIGMPWLQAHNPTINWDRHKLSFTLEYCERNCVNAWLEDSEELEIMELAVVQWAKNHPTKGQISLVRQIAAQITNVNPLEISITKVGILSFVVPNNKHLSPFVKFILTLRWDPVDGTVL